MALSFAAYADLLDERDLIWPKVDAPTAVRATPSLQPLPEVRLVLWDVYGTLLRISGGRFDLLPKDTSPLEVALEKTIHEFSMWQSMYRKPGPPWQSMIGQYQDYHKRLAMVGTKRRGDLTDVNLVDIWEAIITRLFDKEYEYDTDMFGDRREFSERVAFFFHSNLQGLVAREHAASALNDLHAIGISQGFLADAQVFTMTQLLRALSHQGTLPPLMELIHDRAVLFSYELGIRKPSPSLFQLIVERLKSVGIHPHEVLHISCRLETDLAPARAAGMKTALLAAEKMGLEAPPHLIRNASTRPDRLLTSLDQVGALFGLD